MKEGMGNYRPISLQKFQSYYILYNNNNNNNYYILNLKTCDTKKQYFMTHTEQKISFCIMLFT